MTREEAYNFLNTLIKSPNLIKHHLAAEATMREIGQTLKEKDPNINIEDWGLVGLLHDADYEITRETPQQHALVLEQKINGLVRPEIIYAIKCHNCKNLGIEPKSLMDWAIYTCDELTGFIIACALVLPDKKIASVTPDFVLSKMKVSSFAKAVDRNQIMLCEGKLGIPLTEFVQITLQGMQKISNELGL
ncbi:phosphohydrolase [Candidatus Parcubacteria bacterium]|nr:MAG: phosphohydrolase [Candidatus Parcubacteria bacterium]